MVLDSKAMVISVLVAVGNEPLANPFVEIARRSFDIVFIGVLAMNRNEGSPKK